MLVRKMAGPKIKISTILDRSYLVYEGIILQLLCLRTCTRYLVWLYLVAVRLPVAVRSCVARQSSSDVYRATGSLSRQYYNPGID